MPQLFFNRPFQEAIRAGTKRTTIRRWTRPLLQAGQRAFSPGLGWLAIEAVEPIALADLDDSDAKADGFETVRALCQVLRSLYPDHEGDGKQWFRVMFHLRRTRRSPSPRSTSRPSPSLLSVFFVARVFNPC